MPPTHQANKNLFPTHSSPLLLSPPSPTEVATLKKTLSERVGGDKKKVDKKKLKEFLVRMMYVEMLGHDGSFGYIKAVELAAATSIIHKRTGYLTCGAVLSPDHEFRFMLINQLQRDLASSNILEVCAALAGVVRLITGDMVATVVNDVGKLLTHQSGERCPLGLF